MNILLVYPQYPDTFWSFKYALKFIHKKATHPPLGLLTIAAMLPENWNKKLIDMNVEKLKQKHIKWADYVFISAMTIQKKSVKEVIKLCKSLNKKIVAGGPLFTEEYEEFEEVDHLILNEGEITLPQFLKDLERDKAKHIYKTEKFPDLKLSPTPLFELVNMKKYVSMNIQYSRGCPFNCEFCDITALFGKRVRTKSKEQIIEELDKLYKLGWSGNLFFVDDNFIGNKFKLKKEILPAMIKWMENHKYPFLFTTEASINLADDEELMKMMVKAGFVSVFIGIETPEESSLAECSKFQNIHRDLVSSIKKIQDFGLVVTGGFIVGFDNDPPNIFQKQVEFIRNSKIIVAMVGLLNAPKNTKLYKRLLEEKRLLSDISGNNTDLTINFIPKMDLSRLIEGYKWLVKELYSIGPYYDRVINFLKEYNPPGKFHINPKSLKYHTGYIFAFFKSIWILGIVTKERKYFWKLFFWAIFKAPRKFSTAITYAIYGYHFRKTFKI